VPDESQDESSLLSHLPRQELALSRPITVVSSRIGSEIFPDIVATRSTPLLSLGCFTPEANEGEEEEFFIYKEQEKADPSTAPEEDQCRHQICKEEARQEVETWSEKGFWEEEWQEIGLACDCLDSFLGLSCTNISRFHDEHTSCASRSFLLNFLPFSSVVNVSLRPHIQVCIYFFQVHVLSSRRINIFNYNTYLLIVTYMPREIALFLLTFSTPNWLLGS